MKMPFDLGIKLLFRLLLPGAILTLGIHPMLAWLLRRAGAASHWDVALGVSVMALGWLVVILDMPIYMFLEGRAFWPSFAKRSAVKRQVRRVQRIERLTREFFEKFSRTADTDDERAYQEFGVLLRQYPLDKAGRYVAPF